MADSDTEPERVGWRRRTDGVFRAVRQAGPDHGPSVPRGLKATASPSMYCAVLARIKVSKIFRAHLHWNSELLGIFLAENHNFSLEISGPKVAEKCSLYRATRALRLQPHQPHGWSGPDNKMVGGGTSGVCVDLNASAIRR